MCVTLNCMKIPRIFIEHAEWWTWELTIERGKQSVAVEHTNSFFARRRVRNNFVCIAKTSGSWPSISINDRSHTNAACVQKSKALKALLSWALYYIYFDLMYKRLLNMRSKIIELGTDHFVHSTRTETMTT